MKVIAVLGLSGVGKSRLVKGVGERRKVLHLIASDLIKARLAQTSEQLREGAVVDNQALMLEEFAAQTADCNYDVVVFDGHSIIDTPNGLLEIPLSVFHTINPSMIVFVEAAAQVIAERRASDASRLRPIRTADELSRHQELAKARAAHFAETLGVPFRVSASDSVADFIAMLG